MTLVAPTSNPARRQWAAIIQNNLRSLGIDARLIYTSFGTMSGLSFGCSASNCGKTYDNGGFDAVFVGFGGGTPLPDFGTQNVVDYRSLNNADLSPIGANFEQYRNATFNALASQYNAEFNAAARVPIAQKMVAIVAQDRPTLPIYYPVDTYGVANYINPWGNNNSECSCTVTHDFQHWKLTGGHTAINVGETGDISSVNQWVTAAANTFYDAYLYNTQTVPLEELDGRTLAYFNSLATSITGSSDHLTWTVNFLAHNFQDGVPVTANDYLFSTMGGIINDVGYVSAGTLQGLLGNFGGGACNCSGVTFKYSNGTSDYVWNGAYSHGAAPTGFVSTSVWTATSATSFTFTLSNAYLFTDPVITGISAEPMHIFESIPFLSWATSPFATVQNTPYVYHWSTSTYGGNGTATAYGPIGDGPYYYHGYDSVSETGTLVKWSGYWNATGLQSLGQFNAQVIHIVHDTNKDAALADFASGKLNFLDSNYGIVPADYSVLAANGGHATERSSPSAGRQDFSLNDNHPIYGTGTATPNGVKDPAHAQQYAIDVRTAFSHAIPRQYIINNLQQGQGTPAITEFCTCFAFAYTPGITVDTFDLSLSAQFLAAAGYNNGATSSVTIPPPTAVTCGSSPGSGGGAVTVPSFISGNSLTLTGTFGVTQAVGGSYPGWYATLQQSTDGGTTWQPVLLTAATNAGYYTFTYTPTVSGQVWYRAFFTGIPSNNALAGTGATSPAAAEAYTAPQAPSNGEALLNVTDTRYSAVTAITVGSLSQVIASALSSLSATDAVAVYNAACGVAASTTSSINGLATSTNSAITALQTSAASKTDLQAAVNTINGNINNVSYIAYAALAVAIILGLIAIFMGRRKPS
ncbi:MAG: ABC transporter substrate-binding protein [Thaumarchaeota archaeon]|nr:ABC transporter substrate-binding protein [Nitrososphaerota archaeon]